MKRHSSFDNIPTVPKTFSGQWMTFSHMANHYRKLINVKPRVDTGIPRSSDNVKPPSSGKLYKPTSTKAKQGLRLDRPLTTDGVRGKGSRPKLASKIIDYEYHALSKGLINSPNGSYNTGSSSDGYQVVFGPSSIKSSVDAMISDPDPEPDLIEPKLSSISIGEKIRKFLDHIHAQESQPKLMSSGGRPLSSSRGERNQPLTKSRVVVDHPHHTRLLSSPSHHHHHHGHGSNRHSQCFTPFQVPSTGTKKRAVKTVSSTPHPHRSCNNGQQPRYSEPGPELAFVTSKGSPLLSRKSFSVAKVSSESPHYQQRKLSSSSTTTKRAFKKPHQHFQDVSLNLANNNSTHLSSSSKSKASRGRRLPPSPNGTIHGSDELTEEFLLPNSGSPPLGQDLSTIQLVDTTEDLTTTTADWLKERVERGVVRINNAYFSLAPGTSASSMAIHQQHHHHSHHHHPNKDSSRDSAYGFSSGESRFTTRESTPEKKSSSNKQAGTSTTSNKKGSPSDFHINNNNNNINNNNNVSSSHNINNNKYKSSLSTVASSINQDMSSNLDSSGHSSCSEKSLLHNSYQPSGSESKHQLLLEERYYNFLTKVTDDIVSRGIYTNKGIKSIFKSHLMRNTDLEMNKMLNMLERLRMDMGVPKDDSLNQLDFGYGTVQYSAGPYFYRKSDNGSLGSPSSPPSSSPEHENSLIESHHDSDNNNTD